MDIQKTVERMAVIEKSIDARLVKYRRNYNRFVNNGARRDDIATLYGSGPVGFYHAQQEQEDAGTIPVINILKSAVNTLVSKISQTKVRPFFNPINGTFKTRKASREAQVYFDQVYDEQDVYKKASLALRDATIFEYGVLWCNDETKKIEKIHPWELYYDPKEFEYGKISSVHVWRRQYPLLALKDKLKKGSEFYSMLQENRSKHCNYRIYYDFETMEKGYFIENTLIKSEKIEFSIPPFIPIYYEDPIKGVGSNSLVDNLYTIQQQVDRTSATIGAAVALSPANQIFVPKGSDVKSTAVSNETAAIYDYMPLPTGGAPVQVVTPAPISPMYLELLQFWIKTGYESEGISQLSAQSKKPSGINSGVALDTLQDVESERFEVILQSYIRLLMNVAKTCIEVYPKGEDILPSKVGRAKIKWGDIKKERDSFSIQFSASSSLSKDPKTKMEQIEKLIQMQILNPATVAKYLEMPDLEDAYGVKTAAHDENEKIIERVIEDGIYEFPAVTDINGLFSDTVNMLLRLDAVDEDKEVIGRLTKFLDIIKSHMDGVAQINNPQQPPPPPPPPEALTGQQIEAIMGIISAVKAGAIDVSQGVAIAQASLPMVPPQIVQGFFGPLGPQNIGPQVPQAPGVSPQPAADAAIGA